MFGLLRFLLKLAALGAVLAFFGSIGMAYLFAHPEIKTSTVKQKMRLSTPARR